MTPSVFLFRLFIIVLIFILLDIYTYSGVRTLTAGVSWARYIHIAYWSLSIAWFVLLAYTLAQFDTKMGPPRTPLFRLLGATMMLLWLPKLFFTLILLGEDIFRSIQAATIYLFDTMDWEKRDATTPLWADRRKVVSQIALGVAAIPFAAVWHGITWGKYNFKVWSYDLFFDDLPPEFDGLKIAQISDIHAGSLDSPQDIERGIALLNSRQPDLVVFTGDLVNNLATEADPYTHIFQKIDAHLGKFAIVGNHDYGDYIQWDSPKQKQQNFQYLLQQHGKMGFRTLLNENTIFTRGSNQIALVGVENWGLPPFPQHGNLHQALQDIAPGTFTILLSHDPSHWDAQVLSWPHHIHLTLSGHTHGMQFGIEIPGWFRWSPVKMRYPRWAGIYQEGTKFLNVNRGFGFIGFHGRVGIWPEITLITLRRSTKTNSSS